MTYELAKRLKAAKVLAYQRANPEKIRETRRKTNWKIKIATLTHYGGKCTCCGEGEPKFLTIDHINDDGYLNRRQNGRTGVASFYYWIKKNRYPTDLQVLCFNCNLAKGHFKICPHQESATS